MLTEHEIQSILINNLNALMRKEGVSQSEIARRASIEKQTVSSWMRGVSFPSAKNIQSIVDAFGITTDDLLSFESGLSAKEHSLHSCKAIKPSYSYHVVPIVGDVAAGDPCEAIELIDDVLTVPEAFRETHPDARALRIHGESMNKLFPEGTYVVYDPELEIRDGDVAVVYVNGDDATVKRVYFAGDTVVLHPESTMDEFLDRAINTKDPASPPVTFAGRVIWSTWGDREVKF